jgi:ABC-type multidrug transport system fused ATPase/permease subunit
MKDLIYYIKIFQMHLGKKIYLIFFFTLIAALSEGFGILMILPLLQNLDKQGSVQNTQLHVEDKIGLSSYIDNFLLAFGFEDSIIAILSIITIAFIIKGVITFFALSYTTRLSGNLLRELRMKLFKQYTCMDYNYYSSRDTGYFVNVINEQVARSMQSFLSLTQLGSHFINTFVYLFFAFIVAWRFGLMALLAGILLLIIFRWLTNYVRQLSRATADENGKLTKKLIQALQAFKYIISTNQTKPFYESIGKSINKLMGYQIQSGLAASFIQSIREPIAVLLIMSIVGVQLYYFEQPLEPILVSIVLFYRGLNSTLAIQSGWQTMFEYIGSMEMVDKESASQNDNKAPNGEKDIVTFQDGIVLDNVYFEYNSSIGNVINGIKLEIKAKSTVAFVGESGSGKSTLVDLMTLMIRPQSGEIVIDGVKGGDILLESWREKIGFVSQENVTFDDTIANNICLGVEKSSDKNIMKRVQKAAQQAHISQFIESLPDGYETQVGERGLRLSGGQRQRLFIARELFRKPSFLILDEATSALDSESERAIQESIDALKGEITVIIIAHRLSTIRNVDQIHVFKKGKLIENGKYNQLRNMQNSYFSKLIKMQEL